MKIKLIKTILVFLITFFSVTSVFSQTVKGTVYGKTVKDKEPLSGAIVKWVNTSKGTATDENGKFELDKKNIKVESLIISYVGYDSDTIELEGKNELEIILFSSLTTEEIKVESEKKSSYFENLPVKTEVITELELKKDACCDLSGCFGRNSSVEVAVTDIITDSKELKVLGLEGAYTQILVDNLPIFTGLNVKYGVSGIPGTMINKIMVSKGSNSVIQGYNSISGIVNVLIKDYSNSDKLLVNAYMNSMLEKQFNTNYTAKLGKWNTLIAFHTVQKSNRIDENYDDFLDNPLTTRYMIYNKWKMGNDEKDKTTINIAARYWYEEKVGGQKNFNIDYNLGSNQIYGQTVNINNGDVYSRISHKLNKDHVWKTFLSGGVYNQKSYYGQTKYDGIQKNLHFNTLYEFPIARKNYLRAGFSYHVELVNENITLPENSSKNYSGEYKRNEYIPGIFVENSIDLLDKISIIGGIRYDYNNLYKSVITPRLLVRYQPLEQTVVRGSIGSGFRVVDVWNENANLFASSKNLVIKDELNPEKVLNYGVDFLQYFDGGFFGGSINLDYYRTEFYNKIIPDYDTDPTKVIFANNEEGATSDIFSSELNLNFKNKFELKFAYKYTNHIYNLNGVKREQYYNSKHKFFTTVSYSPKSNSYNASMSLQWYGKQLLPSTESNPVEYQRPNESEPYSIINFQFTKNFQFFEIYTGIENLLDFTQKNPIIAADDPFGKYFDTSMIWGPTKGREFYLGFRFLLRKPLDI
jgi:outer membrane receptor for ferrienterochelin and colicins